MNRLALMLVLAAVVLAAQSAQNTKSSHPASPAKADPAEAARLNNLGAAYMGQQRFEDAERLFQRALQLDPSLAPAQLNRAIALLNLQRFEAATAALRAYTKAHAGDARGWYNLGILEKAQGHAQPALAAFQHAVQLAPNDPDIHYQAGAMASQLGRDQEAVAAFQQALKLNPFHASAEFGLARAYQHLGNQQEARAHLDRFQKLTQTKLGAPMSLAYGDQGALSLAEEVRGRAAQPPAPIPVKFTAIPITPPAGSSNDAASEGACFFDYDGDGYPDLFLANSNGQAALYHNDGKGGLSLVTEDTGLPRTPAISCAAADYDNDGRVDLAIGFDDHFALYHNEGGGKFKDVTAAAGIGAQVQHTASLLWFDYDHDGDVDLFITSAGLNVLWRNNRDGTFTNVTGETGLDGAYPFGESAVPADFNNDRAVDLVVGGHTAIYLNPREGKWASLHNAIDAGSHGIAVADFDHDGLPDIAITQRGVGVSVWRNVNGKRFVKIPTPDLHWAFVFGIVALDYDNDGWIDLAAIGFAGGGDDEMHGEIRLLRNEGARGFRDVTSEVGLDARMLEVPKALAAADYDLDGDTDLLVTDLHGALLLRNDGGNANHSLRLALKGTNDNKSAIGTKVEVFAGDLYQKLEVNGASYLGQSATDILIGLGKRTQADVVRLLWPTGVVQDEVEIAAGKTKEVDELDRRASSCPVLFAWDGQRYRFVADMLGAGVVGHWVAPHRRNVPNPTEYVKVEPFAAQTRNGLLSFRLMEPMEEVVYLDQVRLLAVDHPRDVAVWPNERFVSNPPFPDFKVITSRAAQPVRAWDDHGRDVSDVLRDRDRRYVSDFRLLPFKGFTEPHKLELDLGEAYQGGPLRLLMSGYIEYFTATSMYAASQAGLSPIAPYVEAQDSTGKWVRVLEDMGFPAGLPRMITVDLTGKLPPGARRLRITTNLQIYWDQVLVDRTSDVTVQVRDVPLSQAALRNHGYPRAVEGRSPGDLEYVYEDASHNALYSRETGAYTRMGDVRALLTSADDRFAVFGSGEEVALDFDPSHLPPLPSGWTRDYFFFADGYEKDMDFYAAHPLTVAPLPFHAMGVYSSDRAYPSDAAHTQYLLNYNTRFITQPNPQLPAHER